MDLISLLSEVHAIAGTEIQPQFRDALAYRLDIAKEPVLQPVDTDTDSGSGLDVEAVEPFCERFASGVVVTNENLPRIGFQGDSPASLVCDI